MAYAQLVFSPSAKGGEVLKSLGKVLTGELQIANLPGVIEGPVLDQNNNGLGSYKTEILNANAENWSLEFPTDFLSSTSTTFNTFTIRSACITNTKYKRVRFILTSTAGSYTEPVGGTATNNTALTFNIAAQGLTGIDASGVVTGTTPRSSNGGMAPINKHNSTLSPFVVWLSWSARHLFILSSAGSLNLPLGVGRTCYFMAGEFDETPITSLYNSVPCIYMTGTGDGYLSTTTADSNSFFNAASILGAFNPITGQSQVIRSISTSVTNGTTASLNSQAIFGADWNNTQKISRLSSIKDGKRSWEACPIMLNDIAYGNSYINLTKNSNIWLFLNAGFENSIWQMSDGSKYKALNIYSNSPTISFSTVLVKYG